MLTSSYEVCSPLIYRLPLLNNSVFIETSLEGWLKSSINGEQTSYDEVNKYLNELLFENSSQKPSFRSTIKSFVRILMTKDNTQFLKVLDNFSNIC